MANQNKITAAFVQQFHDTYDVAAQQNESRLLKTVVNRGKIEGESFTVNDMGSVEMQASGARFGDTNWSHPDVGVRTALMSDWDLFIPIEPRDLPKLKAMPQDKYMKLLISARERKIDDIIYAALVGPVTRKVVDDAGATTVSTVNLPAGQIIAPAFGTLKKQITKAKTLFRANECDEQNGEEIFITYTSDVLNEFLNDTVLTSSDHLNIEMLRNGAIGHKWLGVTWVAYEKVGQGATVGTKRLAMYCKSAVHFGDADITSFDISNRPDKKNAKQVGGVHSFGAARANELKVVAIDYTPA
ncbi:phage capsid protein [Acinetobacter lwoffii]|uniref:phage capsid protein n=1 Tax=Acinetobacter lwoffii TaxID=28090 RepID=UPI001FF54081|nr:phage capsid protein [Acinetobacter lwoffii]MCJ8512246.1 phage capsid protein [Acinetobacter lwoffii]